MFIIEQISATLTLSYIAHDATPYGVRTDPNAIFGTLFNGQATYLYGSGACDPFREDLQSIGRRIGIEEAMYDWNVQLWLVDHLAKTHVRQP